MEYKQHTASHKDTFFTTYILFYALGTVCLVYTNFFTTATDYWMYKFRDSESNVSYNSENRTTLQAEFTADYSIVSSVSNAVFIVVTIVWIRIRLTILTRLIMALCGIIAVFVFTCIFIKVDTDKWQTGFMVITLLSGCILTGFSCIFLVTIYEMAPKFPPTYTAVLFSGQAICGILSAVAAIVSLSIDSGPEVKGIVYFLSGMSFVLLTLLGFLISLKKSQFFQHHFWKKITADKIEVSKEKIVTILQKMKLYLIVLFIASGSTIMIHPGVTSLVLSVEKGNGNKWDDVYFAPVITFLVYCTSDYLGRELATILKKPSHPFFLLSAVSLRLALIPMIMLCNAQPREHMDVVFNENYAYLILIIIFASTHGFLANICVIRMSQIPTDDEKPLTMFFLMIVMVVSMAVCSFASTGLVKAL